jgi:choline dehydrogenase
MAARLAGHGSVLLIEAGGSGSTRTIRIPAAFPRLFKTSVDWTYFTEPELQLHNRRLYWPRGKVVGGCSAINAMIYVRGHRSDYDAWRDAGNAAWGYDDLLPYFLQSEDNERGISPFHATGGPLPVSDQRSPNPLTYAFIEACTEIGIHGNDDFNGLRQEGVGLYQVNQRGGERWSAARSFLEPLLRSGKVAIITSAHAVRILFDKQTAVGVEYRSEGSIHQVMAAGSVILACGSVNTPQLLMLSGVGPAHQLRARGIPVLCDLPGVGRNLQDHLSVGVMYQCTQNVTLDKADTLSNLANYLLRRRGPFTSNIAEAGAFVRSSPDLTAPDLQFLFGPAYFINHGFTRPDGHGFSIGVVQLRPESRGSVELRSSNPFDAPVIRANYLSAELDRKVLYEGLRIARRIAAARAFDAWRGDPYLPASKDPDPATLMQHIRSQSQTMYHPVGTCKMGSDAASVVDSKLRVHGINNLRIADASIMPSIIGGNTNAPSVMIAERAAAMIIAGENNVEAEQAS